MGYQIFQLPKQLSFDSSAQLLSGTKAYFYATGTTTPQTVYSNSTLTTPHTFPVVADSAGVLPVIYLDPSIEYKVTLKTSADVLIYTQDPVNDQFLSQSLIGQIFYPQTPTEDAAGMVPVNNFVPSYDICGEVRPDRYGAVGDGVTDDYAIIQACLNFAFDYKLGDVKLMAKTYLITKPLYVYGSDNYIHAGVRLKGCGVDDTTLKKSGHGTTGDTSWYSAIDAVVILTPRPAPTSVSATGVYNAALMDMTITGDAGGVAYGVYTKDTFGQVKMERLCIAADRTFRTDANMWLSSFKNISLHPTIDGFWMNASGTSIELVDVYVLGGSGTGFNLQSIYSSAHSIACEGFTGTPFVFKFAQWTVNGLGVECAAATGAAVNVSSTSVVVLNSPLILCPSAFLCATGCILQVNGPVLGDDVGTARSGYKWFVAGTGKLSIRDALQTDTYATANTGFASILTSSTSGSGAWGANKIEIIANTNNNTQNALDVKNSDSTVMLQVRNDGLITTGVAASSPYNLTTATAANVTVDSSGYLYRSTSSQKYKKNIADATHGLAEVMQLRPVTYEGKSLTDAGKVFGGLIAEEVHDAGLTEFVMYADDGSPDALAYANMVSLLVKAIQELKREVNELKAS